jgi:hypothetical protein
MPAMRNTSPSGVEKATIQKLNSDKKIITNCKPQKTSFPFKCGDYSKWRMTHSRGGIRRINIASVSDIGFNALNLFLYISWVLHCMCNHFHVN